MTREEFIEEYERLTGYICVPWSELCRDVEQIVLETEHTEEYDWFV